MGITDDRLCIHQRRTESALLIKEASLYLIAHLVCPKAYAQVVEVSFHSAHPSGHPSKKSCLCALSMRLCHSTSSTCRMRPIFRMFRFLGPLRNALGKFQRNYVKHKAQINLLKAAVQTARNSTDATTMHFNCCAHSPSNANSGENLTAKWKILDYRERFITRGRGGSTKFYICFHKIMRHICSHICAFVWCMPCSSKSHTDENYDCKFWLVERIIRADLKS